MRAQQFWMVKGRGPTSYVHDSLASAEAEAERLARSCPGEVSYVLEAVAAQRKVDVERISLRNRDDDEEFPF